MSPDRAIEIVKGAGLPAQVAYHWVVQFKLACHRLIPWLEDNGVSLKGSSVAEIGCGEAGVLMAAMYAGATRTLGTDILDDLIYNYSAKIAQALSLDVQFTHHDVIKDPPDMEWEESFDIVLLRDVLEHLEDPVRALVNISRIMKPGATLMITFPPYFSPFGGHQQLLGTLPGKIPFVHWMPGRLFDKIVRASKDSTNADEVRRLRSIKLNADKVRAAARGAGMIVADEKYFLLRPVFRYKYGTFVPAVDVSFLKKVAVVRNLAMESAFLLRKPL